MLIFLVLLPVSLCDLYCYRVPNCFIAGGLALSLYRNMSLYGMAGLWHFTWNGLIPIVVCFIFYLLHFFGAGDIKLFSIISSYFNFKFCFRVMIFSLVIGALFSIVKMIHKRNVYDRFQYFFKYVESIRAGKLPKVYYDRMVCGDDGVIPFTICISTAVILCLKVYPVV